jgi:hypothetical protein
MESLAAIGGTSNLSAAMYDGLPVKPQVGEMTVTAE